MTADMDGGLSRLQVHILVMLAQAPPSAGGRMVRWEPSRWHQTWTPVDRAAFSRALQRLEVRGLLVRQDRRASVPGSETGYRRHSGDPFMGRTTDVEVTVAGREVMQRLTSRRIPDVNRLECVT